HVLQLRVLLAHRDHLLGPVAENLKTAVFRRRQLEHQRSRAREVADNKLDVAERARECTGIAINAQDGRRHFRAGLPNDQAPGALALVALDATDELDPIWWTV
ncbi:MAG: hypothetical protein NTX20_00005, partial [Verrucomicrobia bacterium]|nr:hypothetical protein [Verrucomicrobiota bacterium]